MTMSRVRQLIKELDIDERTDNMSDEALWCRSRGHKWGDRGMSRKQYNDLLQDGLMMEAMYCENRCGCTWTITFKIRNGEIVENKREYPRSGGYLIRKGSGRLNRSSARVARTARQLANAA